MINSLKRITRSTSNSLSSHMECLKWMAEVNRGDAGDGGGEIVLDGNWFKLIIVIFVQD